MKQNRLTPNTERLRKQLDELIPSPDALRVLDALFRLVGATRWDVAKKLGTDGVVVMWAFQSGKSERAQEVRELVLAELDKRIEGQSKAQDFAVAR